MSAQAHAAMVAAVAPFVDTSISKTVNVPADYPYADFQDLYLQAWEAGLKGLATYRPNAVLGSVLSVDAGAQPRAAAAGGRRRRQPAPARSTACRRRCSRRCAGRAGPSCPAATRPGPT